MFLPPNTFAAHAASLRARGRRQRVTTVVSLRKVLRVAIVLTMSFLCWIGIGCFAFELFQLAGH